MSCEYQASKQKQLKKQAMEKENDEAEKHFHCSHG